MDSGPDENHPGRLCRLPPGGGGIEGHWRVGEARASTDQQVTEQSHRTGPPARQTTAAPMPGLQSFRTATVVISGIELAEKIKKNSVPNSHQSRE
jgi:hypothetical protein